TARQFLGFKKAAAVFAKQAGGVRLIEHQPGAVLFLELEDLPEGSQVPIHAEDTFRNNENARISRRVSHASLSRIGPFQNLSKRTGIIVPEEAQFRARKPRGVNERGMRELVEDDDVVLANQRGDCAERGAI